MDIEITTNEEAVEALNAIAAFLSGEAAGSVEAATVTIPTADEVKAMSKDEVKASLTSLGVDIEGKKSAELLTVLTALANIHAGDDDKDTVDAEDLNATAEALGLTPDKKTSKTLEAVKSWLEALGESAGEPAEDTPEGEEPAAEEPTAEGAETPEEVTAEEPTAEEPPAEGAIDREAIAKAVKKLPDDKTQLAQLTAYNKAVGEQEDGLENPATEIEFDKKKPKAGYVELLAALVADDETVTPWGQVYVRDGSGYCCGLMLKDVKIKNDDRAAGKCRVTGKFFVVNEAGDGFDPYSKK